MKLLEEDTCYLKFNSIHEYSNQKSAWKIKKTIEQNKFNYKFTTHYTDNELKSVCVHIVSERDLFLSKKHKDIGELLPQETFMFLALYLMQNEKKTKRLGLVLETYWGLSNEYLLIKESNEQEIQYFDINDENILINLENPHLNKNSVTIFGISDSFMRAVKECEKWNFNIRKTNSKNEKSAIGLMKLILNFQLENEDTYIYYEDTAFINGLTKEDIQTLINPRVVLQINKINPLSLRRISEVALRLLDNLEQISNKNISPLNTVFVLQIIGWDKLHKHQSNWIKTKKGNIYRNQIMKQMTNHLYSASVQVSKEKQSKFVWNCHYENISKGIESECGEKNWLQLKNKINKYGMRSKKILCCSSQNLSGISFPKKIDRYINRLVQIDTSEQELIMKSNLLEEHQKNWREDVYLSKVHNKNN